MSEPTTSTPKSNRPPPATPPPEPRSGQETSYFERRRAELAHLLGVLDREFWKHGLTETTGEASPATESSPEDDEEERRRVKRITGVMFCATESRLAAFAEACARLTEDERASLAMLLRLPDAKRRAITAILRLPEPERNVLRITFALSEQECTALADLLRPLPARATERPSITIIDPSVVDEGHEDAPSGT